MLVSGHRVFMEAAFGFQERYKFALTTTQETVQGLRFCLTSLILPSKIPVILSNALLVLNANMEHLHLFVDISGYQGDEEVAIWLIKCSDIGEDDPCAVYKYKDNMDLTSLARFARAVDRPMIVSFVLHPCTCAILVHQPLCWYVLVL